VDADADGRAGRRLWGAGRQLQARGFAVCGSYAMGVFEQAKAWLGEAQTLTMPHDDPHR